MKKPKKGLSQTAQYAIAVFLVLLSMGAFASSAFSGILVLLSALIACPATRNALLLLLDKFLGDKVDISNVKGWMYGAVAGLLFLLGVMVSPTNTDVTPPDTGSNRQEIETVQEIEEISTTYTEELTSVAVTEETTEENSTSETATSDISAETVQNKEPEVVEKADASQMEVHFIDVGQGDATLIKADGHYMLIDAGDNTKGTAVWSYLSKQGVDKLDYLILTHTDADHIGGADVIVNKFDIDTVFMGDFKKDNKTYEELLGAFKYKNLTYSIPTVGNEYSLGNATFTILAPNNTYSDPNNNSIALIVKNKDNSFLFTGDCEEEAEKDILANGLNIDCDVYKVGHHGSKTASSAAFLKTAGPSYGVISCEEGNSYGHPHAEPLNSLRSMNVKLFRTDEQGSIVAYSDGTNIIWNCAPTDSWKAGESTISSADTNSTNTTGAKSSTRTKEEITAQVAESLNIEEEIPQAPSYTVIGNVNSKAFHRESCSRLPKEKNRAYFGSREEALAAGYNNPCDYCNP